MYLGKVRAMGSCIRNFEGAAGRVVRWIRLIDTAVAVELASRRTSGCCCGLPRYVAL